MRFQFVALWLGFERRLLPTETLCRKGRLLISAKRGVERPPEEGHGCEVEREARPSAGPLPVTWEDRWRGGRHSWAPGTVLPLFLRYSFEREALLFRERS